MESNTAVLDKTREVIKDTCRGEVGVQLAKNIATRVQLLHINESAESYPRVRARTSRGNGPGEGPSRGVVPREGDA